MSNDEFPENPKADETRQEPDGAKALSTTINIGLLIFAFVIVAPGSSLIFPMGLVAFADLLFGNKDTSFDMWSSLGICWGLYFTLGVLFAWVRNAGVRAFVAFIFCLLLLFNLGGCVHLFMKFKASPIG